MNPLYQPTSHSLLEADHLKRHAIKQALVLLIESQEPITPKSARRGHGWKLEKLLLAAGYSVILTSELQAIQAK